MFINPHNGKTVNRRLIGDHGAPGNMNGMRINNQGKSNFANDSIFHDPEGYFEMPCAIRALKINGVGR